MKKTSLAKRVSSSITKPEEGILLTKKDLLRYQYLTIDHSQVVSAIRGLSEAINTYKAYSETISGVIRDIVEMQQVFAEQIRGVLRAVETFREITTLIQIPTVNNPVPDFKGILDLTGYSHTPQEPVRIFVQPNTPFESQKALLPYNRKRELPLTAVQIIGDGFTLEGEYISGFSRQSEVGQLFELMLRADLKGRISDELFDGIKKEPSNEIEYRARDFVMRDLKKYLAGNKLKLDVRRYRTIKEYRVKSITKYIRKPKKARQLVVKTKIN